MNDEIKEILELINTKYEDYYIDDFLSGEDVKKLADYINNLQQKYNDNVTKYEELLEKYFNTQQRIDKAIEYIETQHIIFANYDIVVDNQLKQILDILKGDSDV